LPAADDIVEHENFASEPKILSQERRYAGVLSRSSTPTGVSRLRMSRRTARIRGLRWRSPGVKPHVCQNR
jgi:hypothetical protein